jgi:hypothetical protein
MASTLFSTAVWTISSADRYLRTARHHTPRPVGRGSRGVGAFSRDARSNRRLALADEEGLVRLVAVDRAKVFLGVDGHRLDVHLRRCTEDADGDLTAVRRHQLAHRTPARALRRRRRQRVVGVRREGPSRRAGERAPRWQAAKEAAHFRVSPGRPAAQHGLHCCRRKMRRSQGCFETPRDRKSPKVETAGSSASAAMLKI